MGVFDGLAFVEDDVVEGLVLQGFDVAHQGAVGGEDEVVFGEVGGVAVAVGAGQGIDAQVGGEFFGFELPVVDERGRGDDEAGFLCFALVFEVLEEGEGL